MPAEAYVASLDVSVTKFTAPTSIEVGKTIDVTALIAGPTSFGGFTPLPDGKVRFYLSKAFATLETSLVTNGTLLATVPVRTLLTGGLLITATLSVPAYTPSGTYYLYAAVSTSDYDPDRYDNLMRRLIQVQPDITPPLVSVTGVTPNEITNRYPLTICYSASDPHLVSATGTLNGAPFSGCTDTTALPPGENEVVVVATDGYGNITTRVVPFTIDYTPPIVTPLLPVDNALVNVPTVELQVAAADTVGIASVLANGAPMTAAADGTFRLAIPLFEGLNTILVEARDLAGNVADTTLYPWRIRRDMTLPSLTVASPSGSDPSARALVSEPSVLFKGSSSDLNGITSCTVRVFTTALDDPNRVLADTTHQLALSPYPAQPNGVTFEQLLPVQGGLTTVTIVAVDAAQNSRSAVRYLKSPPPSASLDWSLAERYGANRDQTTGVILDPNPYPATFDVWLNACASAPGLAPISSYTFSANATGAIPSGSVTTSSCLAKFQVPADTGAFNPSVVVRDQAGMQTTLTLDGVLPKDILIVSLGDSYASGEGNPDVPVQRVYNPPTGGYVTVPAIWQNESCHRSANAPAAKAAMAIETRDPKTTVTFLSAACSGATTLDVVSSQLADIRARLSPPAGRSQREIDLLIIGAGGNDLRFEPLIEECVRDSCPNGFTYDTFFSAPQLVEKRIDDMMDQIRGGANALPARRTILTEYPDFTRKGTDSYCTILHYADVPDLAIWPSESRWLSNYIGLPLNRLVLSAAARNHLTFATGILDASIPHGYCASERWIHTNDSATAVQGCDNKFSGLLGDLIDLLPDDPDCISGGAVHPNAPGTDNVRDGILRAWDAPGVAVFDSVVGAPICGSATSSCTAGPDLLGGYGGTGEPNAPNATLESATDSLLVGTAAEGAPHVDGLRLAAAASAFSPGAVVSVDIDVHLDTVLWSVVPARVELWVAGKAMAPTWALAWSGDLTAAGQSRIRGVVTLPEGNLQAIRARTVTLSGTVIDTDDVVFAVLGAPECPKDYIECDGQCVFNDPNNCGACGNVCTAPPLLGPACVYGQCM